VFDGAKRRLTDNGLAGSQRKPIRAICSIVKDEHRLGVRVPGLNCSNWPGPPSADVEGEDDFAGDVPTALHARDADHPGGIALTCASAISTSAMRRCSSCSAPWSGERRARNGYAEESNWPVGWMTPDAASRDCSKLPPTPRLAKSPHQTSEYPKHHRVGTRASYLPFESARAASSAGRDLMERSSMEHSRWQKNLRQLRLRAGLTEQALANRLGVTYHAIQAWEKGQRAVRKEWVSKLAAALDCDAAELRK
jgi:DNA-binding XRE family transcriptional regulator